MTQKSKSLKRRLSDLRIEANGIEIIKTKEGYGYSYADLPSILDVLTPMLHKYGIGYHHRTSFDPQTSNNVIETELFSYDNEDDTIVSSTLIDGSVKLGGMNQFMVEGSAITYFRRYHLVTMCGLTTDEDTDAGGKKQEARKPGRSVDSIHRASTATDYVGIFKNLLKTKAKASVEKTFETYKAQFSKEEHAEIRNLIDNYENE